MVLKKLLGWLVGLVAAVLLAPLALLAGRRPIHAKGAILRAEAHVHPDAVHDPMAAALGGPAIVRLSPTTPKGTGAKIIGLGVRFRRRPLVSAYPDYGDQDLLLATFEGFKPKLLKKATQTTNVDDWLANEYRSVMKFRAGEASGIELRAVGMPTGASGEDPVARLEDAIERRTAALRLERREGGASAAWKPLVELRLCERVDVPPLALHPANLRMNPRRSGRGIEPEGFIAAIRDVVYPAVQAARGIRGG